MDFVIEQVKFMIKSDEGCHFYYSNNEIIQNTKKLYNLLKQLLTKSQYVGMINTT